MWLQHAKQCSVAMVCNLEYHTMRVISVKLDIDKKIKGLEIMAFNHKKIDHVSKLIELHCLQGCFRK